MNQLFPIIAQEESGGILSFAPLFLLLPLLYFMVVPQRKQRKEHAEFISNIEEGDEVVTSSGIIGLVNAVEGNEVHLQVDTDVVIRVLKGSLSSNATNVDEANDDESDADSKESE